jgi:uncharacterized hydrophobic protein (TIGR00341 family)
MPAQYPAAMTLRLISVSLSSKDADAILAHAEAHGASGLRVHRETQAPDRVTVEMIAGDEHRQDLLDAIQRTLVARNDWQISLLPVETTIPLPASEEETEDKADENGKRAKKVGGLSREEILNQVWSQAQIGRNYIVFVILSAVVAAFGMIADNVAVVIGAMVIAPLLGPMLAFAVGVALGEERLMLRATGAAAVGIALAFLLGLAIGALWPILPDSHELLARTEVGFDGIAIALASGAAAALSLVTGLSSALVGVMVAVALLPPVTASGIFLGAGDGANALDALLLLGVNIVCVNLAAQSVMLLRGITPRTWFEKRKARRGSLIYAAIWLGLLLALGGLLLLRSPGVI